MVFFIFSLNCSDFYFYYLIKWDNRHSVRFWSICLPQHGIKNWAKLIAEERRNIGLDVSLSVMKLITHKRWYRWCQLSANLFLNTVAYFFLHQLEIRGKQEYWSILLTTRKSVYKRQSKWLHVLRRKIPSINTAGNSTQTYGHHTTE